MNKTTKGAIAAATAGVLLIGGAGTLAFWSDSATVDGGSVNSGKLTLDGFGAGTWADATDGTPETITDIADFNIVPGDILTYTAAGTIGAVGDNLTADLTVDTGSVTGDPELLGDVTVTPVVTVGGVQTTEITEANDSDAVQAVVTFNFSNTSLNPTQLQSFDLSALSFTLQQD